MSEVRLIDANALKKKIDEVQYTQEFCIEHRIDYSISMQMLGMIIDNAPTVEQEVYMTAKDYNLFLEGYKQGNKDFARPQGKWISANGTYYCSRCKHYAYERQKFDFCQDCGADMRGNNNEKDTNTI